MASGSGGVKPLDGPGVKGWPFGWIRVIGGLWEV
jgi:hypothetical protein